MLNAVAMAAANNPAAVGGVGGFPGSLTASLSGTAPGSPARNFSQLGQQGPASQQPSFPSLPAALSSQLQGRQSHQVSLLLASSSCYIWLAAEASIPNLAVCGTVNIREGILLNLL